MPFLPLPNGSYVEVPSGLSDEQAFKLAKEQFPEGFEDYAEHKKKTGLLPAVKSGFKEGAGSALEGIGNLFGSEDVAKYGKQTREEAAGQYEPTTSADMDVARRQGITSLLGTGLSKYITEPVGQAVGSVAGRYGAPIAAGAAATALAPEGAVLGAGAGALGFAAANFPIHFGEDITAQKEAGQQPDYGRALIPALAQTAIDSLGGEIVGGAMRGFALKTATQEAKLLAPKVLSGELAAKDAAAQISGKLTSVLKGTVEAAGAGTLMSTVGTAGQRFAAGQDVFSPEALDQYTEGAKQMGLVAPFFGLLHAGQPRKAKALIDNAAKTGETQRQQIVQEQQAGVMQDFYTSPEGQAQLQAEREPIIQQIKDLQEVLKGKGLPKEEKEAGRDQLNELQKQLEEINKRPGVPQVPVAEGEAPQTVEGRLAALKAQREQIAQAEQERLRQANELQLGEKVNAKPLPNAPSTLTAGEKESAATKEQADKAEMLRHRFMLENTFKPNVERQIDDVQTKLQEAIKLGDTATARALAGNLETLRKSLEATDLQLEALPKPEPTVKEKMDALDKEIKKHNADLQKFSGETFNREKFEAALDKLEKAKAERDKLEEPPAPVQQGLAFEPTAEEKVHAKRLKELTDTFGPEDQHLVGQLVDAVEAGAKERGLQNANEPLPEKVSPRNRLAAAQVEQRRAHDTLADLVDDLRSKEPINSPHAAPGVIGHYITHALNEINAKREAAKQKPLTTDESLKLAFDLKDTLDKVVANKNESVLLRNADDANRLKLKGRMSGEERAAVDRLTSQFNRERTTPLAEQKSQLEKQLEGIKAKYEQGPSRFQKVEEFYLRQERDATAMLKEEMAKKQPNLEKVKALRREVEAGRKENERLEAERAKQEAIDEERYAPSGVNPDQYSLFGAKELEPVATVRATPANFMKFVGIQRTKLQHSIKMAQAALEKVKAKGASAAEDRSRVEAIAAKKGPLIERLADRLEESFAANKEAAMDRSAKLREIFSKPLEYRLLFDIAQTKEKIKQYQEIAAGEKGKFKEGYLKYVRELETTIKQAEKYLEDIRARDTEYFTIEGENNKRSVQMTRRILKEALDKGKLTEEQAAPVRKEIDRIESENQAELEKRVKERRLAEQAMLEKKAAEPTIRQEVIGTNVILPGTKDEILQKRVVEKKAPLTAEDKRAKLREESAEGAKEMQAIRKQLGLDKPNRKDVLADSKAYIKALEERIEVNDKKRRIASPKTEARKKFEGVVNALTKELENEKQNLAEQQKLAKAERALAVAGNEPGRKQKLKPLKKGTADVTKDFEEAARLERDYEPEYSPRVDKAESGAFIFRSGESEGLFRKGAGEGADIKGVRLIADAFREKLPEGVKFEYADTAEALPDYVKAEVGANNLADMKGAVLKDGTIVAVGDRHTNLEDFQSTLAHESIGHYAVDRLLGKKGLVDLGRKIEAQDGGIIRMAREMGVLDDVMKAIRDARRDNPNLTPENEMLVSLREMIAHITEKPLEKGMAAKAVRFIKELVGAVKKWLGLDKYMKTGDADIYALIKRAKKDFEAGKLPTGEIGLEPAYRKAKFSDESDPLAQLAGQLVAKPKGIKDSLKGNLAASHTQIVDRLAPLKEIWRRMGETGPASQMIYNLLMHGQRTNITSETVTNGARIFHIDPVTGERTIRASGGPGGKDIVAALQESKKGNDQALNEMFTAYSAAKRAEVVGYKKLLADGEISANISPAMLEAAKKSGDADPAFVKAFELYQKYNNGLIDNLAQSGYISTAKATEFKNKNYVPYYRSRGGNVDLIIGNESPIRIGSLKDQPYLHELVGGDQKIQDFFKSMVSNTNMITEMALRNSATASVAKTLQNIGIAEIRKGEGAMGPDVIRFKSNGKDYHAVIDTSKNAEFSDISPELLVKGMEGIPTQLPGIVRLMGMPANWLRKGVTRNPFYAYKQLVRDPMSAWLTTGGNFIPILSALKELGAAFKGGSETFKHLQESGILGGEVYTGRAEDLHQIATRLKGGKANVTGALAFMDRVATEADASTRSVLYDSFRKQGLTDMQAQIATMESMNFNTRGASPSMHWVNTVVPFFNSAIQGYNVMYKAFTGKMPYAKKLDLQNKLIKRGSMIAGMSILYAIANQDNDAYKNATPDQKYLNWFVPGFGKDGKEAFRLPIPFEAGYIFKALPEALVNMAYKDDAAKEGLDAISTVLQQTNPLGIPTAIKAPIELVMNRSLYTGKDIESKHLQAMEPGKRAYDTTSEPAKMLGDMLGISPVKLDYLARSYFGGLFTTTASLVNPMLADSSNIKPDGTMSDLPVFGQMFQPEDAGGITQRAYEVLQKAAQTNATYKHLAETGDTKGAEEYLQKHGAGEIGMGASAESMKAQLDQLSGAIRTVKEQKLPPGMNPQQFAVQKREQLTQLQKARAEVAQEFTKSIAEIKRQSSR
jgi:hypothetical protein